MLPDLYTCYFCQKAIYPDETLISNRSGKKPQFPKGSFSHAYCVANYSANVGEAFSKTKWAEFKHKATCYAPCEGCKKIMPISFEAIRFNDLYYHKTCYENEFMHQGK